MRRLPLWLAAAVLVAASAATAQQVAHVTAAGGFDEVRELLVIAIENQGLVIDHRSDVGGMLARTGKDLGHTGLLYERAEVLQFCSASYSRQMMEASRELLAFCPFGIGIYALPGEPGRVHLVYRRVVADGLAPAAAQALRRIDALLEEIVREAAQQ
jgi:uncharacterized protein (DUF302 family)